MAEKLHPVEFVNFDEICRGYRGCTHKLAKLYDFCEHSSSRIHPIHFTEALKRLKRMVKCILKKLQTDTDRRVTEFSLGTADVNAKQGVLFSATEPVSWLLEESLSEKWIKYSKEEYDGLVVIGCIDTFMIPNVIKETHAKSFMNHIYARGLCQALLQHFMFVKPDGRINYRHKLDKSPNSAEKGTVIFVTFKFENNAIINNEEKEDIEETINERTDMQKVLQEQLKINREMSRRLEMLEARVDSKVTEDPLKLSKLHKTSSSSAAGEEDICVSKDRKGEKYATNQISIDSGIDYQKRRKQYSDEDSLQSDSTSDQMSLFNTERHGISSDHPLELDCSSEEEAQMFVEATGHENQTDRMDKNSNSIHFRPQSLAQSSYHSPVPVKATYTGPKLAFPPTPRYTNETLHRASRKIGPRFTTDEKMIILSCYMSQVPRGDWFSILESVKLQSGQLSRELREYYQSADRISLKRRIQDYVLGVLNDKRGRNERCAEVRELIDQIRASMDDSYTVTVPTMAQGDMQMFDNSNGQCNYGNESNAENNDYPVICKIEELD